MEGAGKDDGIAIGPVIGDEVPSKKLNVGGDAVPEVEDVMVVVMVVEKTGVEGGRGQFEEAPNGGQAAAEARSAAIVAEAGDAAAGQTAEKGRWSKEEVVAGLAGGNAEDGDVLAGVLADALVAGVLVGGIDLDTSAGWHSTCFVR